MFDTGSNLGDVIPMSKKVITCDMKKSRPMTAVYGGASCSCSCGTCARWRLRRFRLRYHAGEDFQMQFYTGGPPFKYKRAITDHSNFVNCVRCVDCARVAVCLCRRHHPSSVGVLAAGTTLMARDSCPCRRTSSAWCLTARCAPRVDARKWECSSILSLPPLPLPFSPFSPSPSLSSCLSLSLAFSHCLSLSLSLCLSTADL